MWLYSAELAVFWTVVIWMLASPLMTCGDTVVDIRFDQYKHGCTEDSPFLTSNCDPMFTFCLDRPQEKVSMLTCAYGTTKESKHYQNKKIVNFGDIIGQEINNPWIVTITNLLGRTVMLIIRTRDDDTLGDDDHLITWSTNFTETIYTTRAAAPYAYRTTRKGNHQMNFRIRLYCTEHYYGADCSKYCEVPSTNVYYTCELKTGNKICLKGRTGLNCNIDIDECELDYCARGRCENTIGDYFCHCPTYYTGKNCTEIENPCEDTPCENGGLCQVITDPLGFTCNCTETWEGKTCGVAQSPCISDPCQNRGLCQGINKNRNYTCSCRYGFTGNQCETAVFTTKATTTTPISYATSAGTPTSSSTVDGVDTAKFTGEAHSGGFKSWMGIIICILLLIPVVILVLCFVVRWRRRKRVLQTITVVVFGGEDLAFENNMYNDVNRADEHMQVPNELTIPTADEEIFNPTTFCADGLDEGGATGGYHEMDADGYVKRSKFSMGEVKEGGKPMVDRPNEVEKARSNPYTDFVGLGQNTRTDLDGPHYQDLDEVAIAVKALDNVADRDDDDAATTVQSQPLSVAYSPAINEVDNYSDADDNDGVLGNNVHGLKNHVFYKDFQALKSESTTDDPHESHYTEVPLNTPKISIRYNDPCTDFPLNTPKRSTRQGDPLPPPPPGNNSDTSNGGFDDASLYQNRLQNSVEENPYAEPQSRQTLVLPLAQVASPYTDVPVNNPRTMNPFVEDVFVEDAEFNMDLPNVDGFPPALGSMKTPVLSPEENQYDSPQNNQPSQRDYSAREYDYPRSSVNTAQPRPTPSPPVVTDTSPLMSRPSKIKPAPYEEVDILVCSRASLADLPLAPPPPTQLEQQKPYEDNMGMDEIDGDNSDESDGVPQSLSVRDGYGFEDDLNSDNNDSNDDEKARLALDHKAHDQLGLYLENNGLFPEGDGTQQGRHHRKNSASIII